MQISQTTLTAIQNILANNPSNYGQAYTLVINDIKSQNLTLTSDNQDVFNWFNTAYQVNSGSTTDPSAIASHVSV